MILGFLGKGGSGKSSAATQMALHLAGTQQTVLAVDADHNMDLSFNLLNGEQPSFPFLGESLPDIRSYVGLMSDERYEDVFQRKIVAHFRIKPADPFTASYTRKISPNLSLMAAGPQTDAVLYGKACSHILTTALKIYLPLVELDTDHTVIVDEKAGADGVSTGIVTGIDVGVIVAEPALHSTKVALQIASLMDFHGTPYIFVGNKVQSAGDTEFIADSLGEKPVAVLTEAWQIKRDPSRVVPQWRDSLAAVFIAATAAARHDRWARTVNKFRRNKAFLSHGSTPPPFAEPRLTSE